MLRYVLLRAGKYAVVGWAAAFIAATIRDGVSDRAAAGALWFALIWGVAGAALALYRWPNV